MSTAVRKLLQQVRDLPDRERSQFESAFLRLRNQEIERELSGVRKWAKERGITQQMIDEACYRQRYGKTAKAPNSKPRRR